MRKRIIGFTGVLIGILFLSAACRTNPKDLELPLIKLTRHVQERILRPDSQVPVSDDTLISTTLLKYPDLQKKFAGIPIKVKHNSKNVVLLVCSPDGKHAWFEDESSTLFVDKKWFLTEPSAVFTMEPTEN